MVDCAAAFRVWENGQKKEWPKRIRIVNNLVLAGPSADMVFIDSGGHPSQIKGPGNGARLLDAWH